MNPAFEGKDEKALAGVNIALETIDVLLGNLLGQIQAGLTTASRNVDEATSSPSGEDDDVVLMLSSALSAVTRLTIQGHTIEALRLAIPELILNNNPQPAARIVEVVIAHE